VNTSRGPAINEAHLVQALNEKIIAGAALDVFEEEPLPANNPLRQVDPLKLILTPHNIGANPGSAEEGQSLAAQSMLKILDGKIPDTVVNPLAIPLWKERFGS
jgi:phosphoglycerate dehydrogenase-like enzyme